MDDNNICLENIDVSAIEWFKNKNTYSEKILKELYDDELKNSPANKKKLNKCLNEKMKALKNANKIIFNFKQLRSTYKLIQLALESFDENCGNPKQVKGLKDEENKIFGNLNLEDITKRKKIGTKYAQDNDLPDFNQKKKDLISKSEETFKKNSFNFFEYMPKNLPWYRNIMSRFGSPVGNIRKSKSGKDGDDEMSNWVGNLDKNKKLIDLMIPSSHDSGSYSMAPESKSDIAGRLAQTQKLNIMGQLKSGIRGFDWRMKKQGKILVFYHGIITGTNVMEGVKHVCKFLDGHPNEVIFIRLRSSDNGFKDMFFKDSYVKNSLIPRLFAPTEEMMTKVEEITLQNIRDNKIKNNSKGCVVLLAYEPKDVYKKSERYYCLPNTLFNQKYNKKTRKSGNNDKMIDAEIESIKEILEKGGFTGINTLNTAHWTSIVSQILGLKSKETSVYPTEDAKQNLTNNIEKLIAELKKNGDGKLPNSFGIDNAGSKKVVEAIKLIIGENKKK